MTTDQPTPRSARRAVGCVVALTAGIGLIGVSLADGLPTPLLMRSAPWWVIALVAAGYALAERVVFHAEHRHDAITFSISEAPTAFALAFLDPLSAIVARLVGSVPVIAHQQRPAPYKLAFNSSVFALELVIAYRVLGAIIVPETGSVVRLMVGVIVATAASTLVGVIAVAGAMSCFRGSFIATLIDKTRTTAVTGSIATVVATVAIAPALLDGRLVVVGLLPVAGVWYLLLRHGRLAQRHRDLENVYDFTRNVGRSLRLDEITVTGLTEAVRELRAGRGSLVVLGPDGTVVATHEISGGVAASEDRGDDGSVVDVPIIDAHGTLGSLRVADRQVAATRFDADDIARAGRLADQLAPTLRNALLYDEIEHSALHDSLTGDLNRRGFDEAITGMLQGERDVTTCYAVIVLDLDRFKEINDTFGHQTGDRVIQEFSLRVRGLLADNDRFGRLGADEFAVFAQRPSESEVRSLVDQIIAGSRQALKIDNYQLVVSASAGVTSATRADRAGEQLLRRADVAMNVAKRTRAGSEFYRQEMDRRTPERLALLAELREALDSGALEVHFQPKIEIATSTVIGAEALVRWNHPIAGQISPPEFIRVAEESGLIYQLTDQVLRRSLAVAASWAAAGYDLGVAVNLSALDLVDVELPNRIASTLAECSVDPGHLTLEVTESSLLIDTPHTMVTVERLRELGVRLSLDDFGTGYSSLSYLRQLPAHELKVDRSFVSNVLLDAQDEVIVRSTIDLGQHLGMVVVAEGIENEPMLQRMRELGCDVGQGFGISRPLPADQFMHWLRTTPHAVRRRTRLGNVIEFGPPHGRSSTA